MQNLIERYVKQPLRLGDLRGNHFGITIREVTAERTLVESALASLRENGFINYFGLSMQL